MHPGISTKNNKKSWKIAINNNSTHVSSSFAIFANERQLQVLWVPRQVTQVNVVLKLVQFFTAFDMMLHVFNRILIHTRAS